MTTIYISGRVNENPYITCLPLTMGRLLAIICALSCIWECLTLLTIPLLVFSNIHT